MRTLSDQPAIHQRRSQFNHVRSKRWRKTFDSHIDEGSSQCQNVDGAEYSDNQFRSDNLQNIVIEEAEVASNSMTRRMTRLRHGCAENYGIGKAVEQGRIESNRECSQPFGQASYQRSRQGLVITYEDSGDNIYTCDYCNARFWSGEAIKKSSANAPLIYTNCCKKGQIKIEQAKPTPIFLEKLLNPDNGPESKLFRENIRVYNSMFSFTSMGATIDNKINSGSGPYIFKISGQVYHLMGSILPSEGRRPKYAQLYIYDTKNEVINRINAIDPNHINQNIRLDIVEGLTKMFDETNELVKEFRTIRDKYEGHSVPVLNMTILNRQPIDSKQYEIPINEEIGGLIVGDIGEHNSNKDLIIESNDGHLQRISKIHPKYMSLQYPILFPYGEDGYKPNLIMQRTTGSSAKKRQRISMREYITYQIQDRNNEINTLLKGGRLFQQFLVDAYATVEEDRLDWIRKNQKNFRTEILKEMYTAAKAGMNKASNLGKKIILPSSHTGSPRNMINNYQDAMAICRQYGNPDLFITFTCNVKWIEIQRYLQDKPKRRAEDRPDIISRIFKIKLEDMITYIKSGEPFGKIEAHVHTIEFQKRGLPHAHMLFWLKKDYKCYTAVDIDSIISAELPDKNTNPKHFQIVSEFMIHGPCILKKKNDSWTM